MNERMKNLLFGYFLSGVRKKIFFKILSHYGEEFFKIKNLEDVKGIMEFYLRKKFERKKVEKAKKLLDDTFRDISKGKYGVMPFWDENFPESLLHIHIPPPLLFFKGNISLFKKFMVGVVGMRKPDEYGKDVAYNLSRFLSENGICVVSGLAKGIDRYAHIGALKGEGKTISVLGNGIKVFYPMENKRLQLKIFEEGLVLSEFPPNEKPYFYNFPIRNRILSGLSNVVVVVEADLRSGAIITANYALEQGKDVLAVPGSIFSRKCRGTNKMILDGAYPLISIEDILNFVKIDNFKTKKKGYSDKICPEMSKEEEEVLNLFLKKNEITLDFLVENSSYSIPLLSEILFSLELKGVIESRGNFYRLKEYRGKYE